MRKSSPTGAPVTEVARTVETVAAPLAGAPAVASTEPEDESVHTFTAPIVGTFYLTPKPDAEPFVKKGSEVSEGSVLCVIEAMKIFNQIESDVAGTIVKIFVDNGQPVEFGEPLFQIRPS